MSGDQSNSGGFKPSTEPRRELGGESASEKRRKLEFARTVEAPAVSPKTKPVDPFGKTLTAIPVKPAPEESPKENPESKVGRDQDVSKSDASTESPKAGDD